jgi:hypothetical protein
MKKEDRRLRIKGMASRLMVDDGRNIGIESLPSLVGEGQDGGWNQDRCT